MRVLILFILLTFVASADDVLLVSHETREDKLVYWSFSNTSLDKVIGELSSELGWHISVHPFDKMSVDASFDGVPVKEALRQVLEPKGLTVKAPGNFHGSANAGVYKGAWAWPKTSRITQAFSLEANIPGLTYELSFASDGQRAVWKLLPLSHSYLWCGNSWDYYERGELPQASFDALASEVRKYTWTTTSERGRPLNPSSALYTLVHGDSWTRLTAEQASQQEALDSLLAGLFDVVPSQKQERVSRAQNGVRAVVDAAATGLTPKRNPEVFQALANHPALDQIVSCEFDGIELRGAVKRLAGEAQFEWFIAPYCSTKLVSFRCQDLRLGEALKQLADSVELEYRVVDDLVLFGAPEQLDHFPDFLRYWRSVKMAPDTRWRGLSDPLNLSGKHLQYLEYWYSLLVVEHPEKGRRGALVNPRNEEKLDDLLAEDEDESYTWTDVQLNEVIETEIYLRFLPKNRALKIALELTPELALSQGESEFELKSNGKLKDYQRLRDALIEEDKLESLDEVRVRGSALYHDSTGLKSCLTDESDSQYFVLRWSRSTDLILVKGHLRKLNQLRTISGKVTRLDAPGLSEWVEVEFGKPLVQDDRGIILIEEQT